MLTAYGLGIITRRGEDKRKNTALDLLLQYQIWLHLVPMADIMICHKRFSDDKKKNLVCEKFRNKFEADTN